MLKLNCFALSVRVVYGCLLIASACNFSREKITPTPISTGTAYFPVQLNDSLIYTVKRIIYIEDAANFSVKVDSTTFELLEVVKDTFTNLSGEVVYRIERFARPTRADAWGFDTLAISAVELGTLLELHPNFHQVMPQTVREWRIFPQRIVAVENNIPIIKLIFPIVNNATWDANSFNSIAPNLYRITRAGLPYLLDTVSYPVTVTVWQQEQKSLINKDTRFEIYAQDIGLIHRKQEVYFYVDDASNKDFAQDKIVSGYFYEQKLVRKSATVAPL